MLLHEFAIASAHGFFASVVGSFEIFVVAIGAFVENNVAFAFKREDMSADSVEEPAVVADNDGASGEVVETFFEGAQGVDVDVVGRLVEKKHVAFLLQSHGKVQTVPLAAAEHSDFLLLISAGEVEARQIGPGVDVAGRPCGMSRCPDL